MESGLEPIKDGRYGAIVVKAWKQVSEHVPKRGAINHHHAKREGNQRPPAKASEEACPNRGNGERCGK